MTTTQVRSGRGVARFCGIRFAEPPIGEWRWRPPRYLTGAGPTGTWPADCPQPASDTDSRAPGQDEDCLFLNVWTPTTDPGARLPVLVWFHGGSFLYGSASDRAADGTALAARGAVVVAANYRVGLFGNLAHPALTAESPEGSSGNYGLLDNLAALRWVRDHIAAYGGDPGRVTAFGVSAGSASLALLQTSPLGVGAFDRLILQSPGAWRPLAGLAEAEQAALDAYGDDLAALRDWSADEVLARASALVPKVRALTAPRLVRPIRDGWVVPTDDRDAYRSGAFAPVPTIVGGNADEGGQLTAAWPIATTADLTDLLAANFGPLAGEVAAAYPVGNDAEVSRAVAEVFGDTQFTYGARGIAAEVSRRQPATWRYLYDHRSAGVTTGPGHAAEVAPLFAGSDPTGEAMAAAWVRFAATGDPNGGDLPRWDPYDPDRDNHLVLADPPVPGSGWRSRQLDLIDRYHDDAPA